MPSRTGSGSRVSGDPAQVETVRQNLLQRMQNPQVHLRARIAAGEALGRLGDPRFQAVQINDQRVLLPPLVFIPAGPINLGSSFWEVWRLARSGYSWAKDERPQRRLELPGFYIGQYPVTKAEFACFIDAGGYQEDRWWTPDTAKRWLAGGDEGSMVEDWMNDWRYYKANPLQIRQRSFSPQTVAAEQLITLDESEVGQIFTKAQAERPRDQPGYWHDERYNLPSQPVVGVTWFEARAYCAWLEAQWWAVGIASPVQEGYRVRLPTEAEWEKVARYPDGRRYPWGNRWLEDRANTSEGHVLHPTPVGVYPAGASSTGIHELSSNVWEWTQSRYKPYPYDPTDGRNDPDAEGMPVVRGGSWLHDQRWARSASRLWYPSGGWVSDGGFRVVLSLANAEC